MSSPSASRVPALVYGTAWKKDSTRALVRSAILAGFRGIDTAAQLKHYREDLVGAGIRDALADRHLRRGDLYIQTKFTSVHGQDLNESIPYDSKASITDQVKSSVLRSLLNLDPKSSSENAYLDCLVLHSPYPSVFQTQEAWRAMESHVPHSVRTLGISNIYHLPALRALYNFATVKPSVVQNRFYADTGYDQGIRAFCAEKGILYQSFWTLTANPGLLRSKVVATVAQRADVSKAAALYSLVLALGKVSILNGTTSEDHMKEDLAGIERFDSWAASYPGELRTAKVQFQKLIEHRGVPPMDDDITLSDGL